MPQNRVGAMTDTSTGLLTAEHERSFRKLFRWVLTLVGGLAFLHMSAATSVLPYVWVNDDNANCGARLVLVHAVDGMYWVFAYLGMAFFAFFIFRSLGEVLATFPKLRERFVVDAARQSSIFYKSCTAFLSIAMLALIGTLIYDISFLRAPPSLPPDVKACAHPEKTFSW
jgi:hypothetical protein